MCQYRILNQRLAFQPPQPLAGQICNCLCQRSRRIQRLRPLQPHSQSVGISRKSDPRRTESPHDRRETQSAEEPAPSRPRPQSGPASPPRSAPATARRSRPGSGTRTTIEESPEPAPPPIPPYAAPPRHRDRRPAPANAPAVPAQPPSILSRRLNRPRRHAVRGKQHRHRLANLSAELGQSRPQPLGKRVRQQRMLRPPLRKVNPQSCRLGFHRAPVKPHAGARVLRRHADHRSLFNPIGAHLPHHLRNIRPPVPHPHIHRNRLARSAPAPPLPAAPAQR